MVRGAKGEKQSLRQAGGKAWGFSTTALWVVAALASKNYLFPKFEHLVLDGTGAGKAIGAQLALGALNIAIVWLVPIVLLVAAVRIKRVPVQGYFAWVASRTGDVSLALATGAALQLVSLPSLFGRSGHDGPRRRTISLGTKRRRSSVAAAAFDLAELHLRTTGRRKHLSRLSVAWLGSLAARRQRDLAAHLARVRSIPYPEGDGYGPAQWRHPSVRGPSMGLLLGWLRWRSGSTLTSMAVHFGYNLIPPVATFITGAMFAGH
jgi:hypothetical protein